MIRSRARAMDGSIARWHPARPGSEEAGGLASTITPKLWQPGLLVLGLIAGCGGSASRPDHGAEPPSSTGGAGTNPPPSAGEGAIAGSAAAAAGGVDMGAGGATGDAGSQPSGGLAGAGGAPELALPPGCHPRAPSETSDLCSLAVDCDASPSVRTYCHRMDSGQWECQCANQDHLYRLENTAGLHACALAARLCSDPELELGEESCEHESESQEQSSCSIDFACAQPVSIDTAEEARAWRMRFGSARCHGSEPAPGFRCTCSNGTMSNYGLLVDSGELACGPFADFCSGREEPVFDGEETCSPIYSSSDSEGCQRAASCGAPMPLTDGVSLVQPQERDAMCTPRPGGGSECTCYDHDTAFVFYVSTAPDDASCESAIANCDPSAAIEVTGPPTCEPLVSDGQEGDLCGGFQNCTQPATVDGRTIVARGSLSLVCRRLEPGMPWSCSCASGQDTTRFELGATGAVAAQACSQASTTCLEQLGVHIGPSGDPVQPPDPFL